MNLETKYLGLKLRTPLVPSASPLTGNIKNLRRLEDAGAAAVVLPSLFEEQLRHQFHDPGWSLKHGIEPYPPALSYLPKEEDFAASPEKYLEYIREASSALSIPIIASLGGTTPGNWIQFAASMEAAGADAIELSIYHVPTDFEANASGVEEAHIQMISDVRKQISIPLAVKLAPFFTSFPNFARRVVEHGADGLVLFNRLFNADVKLEEGEFTHAIQHTTSRSIQLPLRWIALLQGRLQTSFAATSGVHTSEDALKLIFVGADVTMLCSSLMIHGIEHLKTMEKEMSEWLEARGHVSLDQFRGRLSMERWPERSALERANYIWSVGNFTPEVKRNVYGE